jgi:hypothetical protein
MSGSRESAGSGDCCSLAGPGRRLVWRICLIWGFLSGRDVQVAVMMSVPRRVSWRARWPDILLCRRRAARGVGGAVLELAEFRAAMCSVLWMWVCDLHAMKAGPPGRHPKVPLGVESSAAAWDTEVPSGVRASVRLRENAWRPRRSPRAGRLRVQRMTSIPCAEAKGVTFVTSATWGSSFSSVLSAATSAGPPVWATGRSGRPDSHSPAGGLGER